MCLHNVHSGMPRADTVFNVAFASEEWNSDRGIHEMVKDLNGLPSVNGQFHGKHLETVNAEICEWQFFN